MSSLALREVQRSLYSKLSGDAVLMDMISGIYDVVPQNTNPPYVVLGNGRQELQPVDALVVSDCQLELHVWTLASGRKAALAILSRLYALLHLGTLTLSGLELVTLRVEQAATSLSEQGKYLSGVLRISITVVEA